MAQSGLSDVRSALVAYGSETGTAQDIAEEIGKLTRRLHFATRVTALSHISLNDLIRCDVVILSVSTTGQGDLPVNARALWAKLKSSKLRPGILSGVKFTSFGIGDSSYPNFNWASRKLSNRLLRLGAQCFCDRGESDEQHPDGIDGLYLSWSVALRERLLHVCPLPPGLFPIPEGQLLPAEWILQLGHGGLDLQSVRANGDVEKANQAQNHCTSLSSMGSRQSLAKLISNQRLTPDTHWQDVRLFEFSIPPTTYCPGDVFTIYPKNPDEDVNALINLMQWNGVADEPVTLIPSQDFQAPRKALASPPPFLLPKSINLRELIQSHFDLNAVPRRSFFATIAQFTADEMQKARLIDFTKPELVDELYDYTTRPRRSILEVLQEFDTVKIPLEWAIAVFPRIRGRQFSIASGGHLTRGLEGDTRVQILVAIVKYRTVIKKVRRGLCTRYLSELELGSNLEVGLSRSGMAVALNKPAIMIGPGTGVAPLRAMVHERAFFTDGASRNEQVLFFGGRNRNADFFFGEEWKVFEQDLELRLWTAFSRDQSGKVYVQDKIRENATAVYDLLQRDAIIYLCGSSGRMPQAVREAITDVIEKEGETTRDEAERTLLAFEKSGRYQQETW